MTEHDLEVMRHCVKRYLGHMKHYYDDVREIELRIKSIENRLGILGVSFDKVNVSTSSEGDKIGSGLADIQELREELKDRLTAYELLFQEAQDICQPRYVGRYAMWLHEVESREWEYVGRIIGYSERQTRTVADGGVVEIYELMPEEYRRYSIPDAIERLPSIAVDN